MSPIWQSLLANLALVSILLVAWDLASDLTGRLSRRVQSLLLGAVLGVGAVASIATAAADVGKSGFLFDLRATFIAASGFFGGWPAALISTGGALLYRAYLGGQGLFVGVVGILVSTGVGLAWHPLTRLRSPRLTDIFGLGVSAALGSQLPLLLAPADIRMALVEQSALPVLAFVFLSTVIVGVLLDRLMRRRGLLSANMMYRAMVRELPDCLNMKDTEGRFLAANPATASLMRARSAKELIGKTDFDFYPHDLAERFKKDEQQVLKSGEALRFDQATVLADGRDGYLATLKVPYRDESGRLLGVITYNRDITEQKRNAQLKDEFISTVSHELRTPLTSIRGSLGLIAAGVAGQLPPKAANLVKIAHTNSERLVRLINDILDMEKIESGKMVFNIKPMAVRPILEQAIAASTDYLPERNIHLVLVDDAPRAHAEVDPDRLHQVLANLLSNAIKFSPPQSSVAVELMRRESGGLRISVVDHGEGIPEAFRDRMFGKFEQADGSNTREKGGTGLGLSIVKAIAERFGGSVSFDTTLGVGTSFHIDLPEAGVENVQTKEPKHAPGLDHRLRVLICEDEPDVSTVIAAMLDTEGFSSDVAPDITSAKALLQSRRYAALTLDIKLAGESGIHLFRDIRASSTNADIPVIVISAVADEARRSLNGSAVGIIDWVEKPFDADRLHRTLAKIANRKVDQRPRILHVEDDEGVLAVMSEGLGPDVSISSARSLHEAQEAIIQQDFDAVILDILLPDGSGLDLISKLPAETAIVIFSAQELDQHLGDRVSAIMTKTKASELDVASLVKSLLPANLHGHHPAPTGKE